MELSTEKWFEVHRGPRPYTELPRSTAEWREIEPRPVRLHPLATTQEKVYVDGLLGALYGVSSYCGDEFPHLTVYENRLWVVDGHHRIVMGMMKGAQRMLARVFHGR